MSNLAEILQTADWKAEKHVPVIDAPDAVKADEVFEVKVSIGAEIPHPNTTEHHIDWIQLFFRPDGDKFSYRVGNFEFGAHGQSAKGPNEGAVWTHHAVTASLKLKAPGTLYAMSSCNIHGLWESTRAVKIK